MGFVEREIAKIHAALVQPEHEDKRPELYAAQQALAWALEPTGVKSPYDLFVGTQAGPEDCSDESRPPVSSGTCAPYGRPQ